MLRPCPFIFLNTINNANWGDPVCSEHQKKNWIEPDQGKIRTQNFINHQYDEQEVEKQNRSFTM